MPIGPALAIVLPDESCGCSDHISVPDFPAMLHQPKNVHKHTQNLFVAAVDVCN